MATSTREEIKVGPMAIRFLIEGEQSGGSVAVFEFDVPGRREGRRPPTATTATRRRSTGSRAS